jgi:urease beta subunit
MGSKVFQTEVPPGLIAIWSGTVANIPGGWAICDGNNGTPDLTGHFVIHADADSGGSHNVGDTPSVVGAHVHTMNAHNHTLDRKNGSDARLQTTNDGSTVTDSNYIDQTVSTMQSAGNDTAYALAFIMKL